MMWRKWFRIVHRDAGYLFFGMCIIYGLSGIALNHIGDWNPSYVIRTNEYKLEPQCDKKSLNDDQIKALVARFSDEKIRKYYWPDSTTLKIFLKEGTALVDVSQQSIFFESIHRRPVFMQMNFLHYNRPKKLWTWFSDAFAVSLVLLAITGIFLIKGKKGITGRGAWLTAIGIAIPLLFVLLYL